MKVKFNVFSFSKLVDPFDKECVIARLLVDITQVPSTIPMDTNPRNQNMSTATVRGIKESLLNKDEHIFHLLNRGLTISAKSISCKDSVVTIDFEDESIHGDIDGGHTYQAILELQDNFNPGEQFVTMEVITGPIIESVFTKLAAARNQSQQIVNKSIAELEKRFEWLKAVYSDEPYSKNIFYRENGFGSIDVADIISIINMFDLETYPDAKTSPFGACTNRKRTMSRYIDRHKKVGETLENSFYRTKNIIVDVIKMYEYIEMNIPNVYDGVFGKLKCIKVAERHFKTMFYEQETRYKIPKAFIYPILGAYRAILTVGEDGFYKWVTEPFAFLEKTLPILVDMVIDIYKDSDVKGNVNSIVNTKDNWKSLYREVTCCYREMMN